GVGKSSFMKSLLSVRDLAGTLSTPGRTQALNCFFINDEFWSVDLPLYGYEPVRRDMKAQCSAAATDYLSNRPQLVLAMPIWYARSTLIKAITILFTFRTCDFSAFV